MNLFDNISQLKYIEPMIFRFWSIILTLYLLTFGWSTKIWAASDSVEKIPVAQAQTAIDVTAATFKAFSHFVKLVPLDSKTKSEFQTIVDRVLQLTALLKKHTLSRPLANGLALSLKELTQGLDQSVLDPQKMAQLKQGLSLIERATQEIEFTQSIRKWHRLAIWSFDQESRESLPAEFVQISFTPKQLETCPHPRMAELAKQLPPDTPLKVSLKIYRHLVNPSLNFYGIIESAPRSELLERLPNHLDRTKQKINRHLDLLGGVLLASYDFQNGQNSIDSSTLNQSKGASPYRTSDSEAQSDAFLAGYQIQLEEQTAIALTTSNVVVELSPKERRRKKAWMVLRGMLTGGLGRYDTASPFRRKLRIASTYLPNALIYLALYNGRLDTAALFGLIKLATWSLHLRALNRDANRTLSEQETSDQVQLFETNRKTIRQATLNGLTSDGTSTDKELKFLDTLAELDPNPELKALTAKSAKSQRCQHELVLKSGGSK